MARTKEVKVKDLKAGDELASTGAIVECVPWQDLGLQSSKCYVMLMYPGKGISKASVWGKNTVVKIKSTDK